MSQMPAQRRSSLKDGAMSLSCFVLSNRPLATIGAWQAAIDAAGFKLVLDGDAQERVEDQSGHLPAIWDGVEAGFECLPCGADSAADFVEDHEEAAPGGPWTQLLEFSYMGVANIAGVTIAGAVYAHATGGIFWEGEEGLRVDADAALAYARKTEAEIRDALARDMP
jgi:hypothetical protein